MKTMCLPGYHYNGFVITHAPGHMSHWSGNWEDTLFSRQHIYYAHLAAVIFEHSVFRGSLMTTYVYIYIYIYVYIYVTHIIYI